MSAAFDTIDRDILLQILKNVEEDELRLIQFLLSNTHINTRLNNADINAPFNNNVGTPQGDGLSPVLLTILYLEHALKEVRTVIGEPKSPLEEKILREIAYAVDVDFVGLEYIDIDAVQRTLHRYNLKVNIDKQKKTSLSKNEDAWRSTKNVGSPMGDKEDVERRKQLSNAALYKLKKTSG